MDWFWIGVMSCTAVLSYLIGYRRGHEAGWREADKLRAMEARQFVGEVPVLRGVEGIK